MMAIFRLALSRVLADFRQLDRHFLIHHVPLDTADGDRDRRSSTGGTCLRTCGSKPGHRPTRTGCGRAVAPQGFGVALLAGERDEGRNVDVRGARVLARGANQVGANARFAEERSRMCWTYSSREVPDGRKDRVGGRLAQAAKRTLA